MRIGLIVIALTLAATTAARADNQPIMPVFTAAIAYTGQLAESGHPVDGIRYFTFNLYTQAVGGAPVFMQSESLTVSGGVYSTHLNTTSTLWLGDFKYLGVSVNGGAELTPRVQMTPVPYAVLSGAAFEAVHAKKADTASVALGPAQAGITAKLLPNIARFASTTSTAVDSITIVAPGPGYLFATFNGHLVHNFEPGNFAVSFDVEILGFDGAEVTAGGSEMGDYPVWTVQESFWVSGGTVNVRLKARTMPGVPVDILGHHGAVMFFPASY
jgi:hypothetical protein